MRHAILALALCGCFGSEGTTPARIVREQSNALTARVNAISDKLDTAAYVVVFVCNVRGQESPECTVLSDAHRVARSAQIAAQKMVDLYDATGVQLAAVSLAIDSAEDAATQLQDSAKRAERALHDLVATTARATGLDGGEGSGEESGARPAPAEGAGPSSEDAGAGAR